MPLVFLLMWLSGLVLWAFWREVFISYGNGAKVASIQTFGWRQELSSCSGAFLAGPVRCSCADVALMNPGRNEQAVLGRFRVWTAASFTWRNTDLPITHLWS